jgi:hypothetical protein
VLFERSDHLHCFYPETGMTRLTALTPAEKKFLDDAVAEAERVKGKKLNQPERHIALNRARAQIYAARYAAKR